MSLSATAVVVLISMTATMVKSEGNFSSNVTQYPVNITKVPLPATGQVISADDDQFLIVPLGELLVNSSARALGNPLGMLLPRGLLGDAVSKSGFMGMLQTTSTTTTTTTTTSPLPPLVKSVEKIETIGTKLIATPMKLVGGFLDQATGSNFSQIADSLLKSSGSPSMMNDAGSKGSGNGAPKGKASEEDWKYYEYAGPYEPYAFRRRKYFSHRCQFRFACEAGKMSKPVSQFASKRVETSLLLQDLQNRYSRAFNYGSLQGNCDRYYCVLVKMMGGPTGFAAGMLEMMNRRLNPDLYEDDGVTGV